MWILPSLARRAHVHYSDTKRCFGLYKTDLEKSVDDEVNSTSEIKGTPKVGGTFRIYNRSSCGGIGLIKDGMSLLFLTCSVKLLKKRFLYYE